jgi:hypothetical protein
VCCSWLPALGAQQEPSAGSKQARRARSANEFNCSNLLLCLSRLGKHGTSTQAAESDVALTYQQAAAHSPATAPHLASFIMNILLSIPSDSALAVVLCCRCLLLLSLCRLCLTGGFKLTSKPHALLKPYGMCIYACVNPFMRAHAIEPFSLPSTLLWWGPKKGASVWQSYVLQLCAHSTAHCSYSKCCMLAVGDHWGLVAHAWVVLVLLRASLGF